ncbi:hypothetical protein B0I33_111223 [Prauserella shujinwangii]|uniref:Uncharacterized protein n=1 Tax=Prauserella shujinwangii TaxID=1453103 RepID=A0A2T0LNH5_9PSEU|nr:hypothetical protein B0I33_111223 [Prauserella shujinwangii]
MGTRKAPEWLTAGQQQHLIVEVRIDDAGATFFRTRCGWLVWPCRIDSHLVGPIRCQTCAWLAGGTPAKAGAR